MASTFIANSYQVNFDSVLLISDHDRMLNMFKALEANGLRGFLGCESVLLISDHDRMLNMFKALEANGLRGFLGCESVLYEKELEQFFDMALIQDGDITGAISGKYFSVSQSQFAEVFELPKEGLVSLSDVPKHLVYKARSIFLQSGEHVSTHGKKRLMKYEYRLLNDILAKALTVKAGSFDAITNECFQMMTAIHFGLKFNWSKVLFSVLKDMVDRTQKKAKGYAAQIGVLLKIIPAITMGEGVPFPISKILSIKTVSTYIAMNHTIDARGQSDEPGVADVAVVKRKSKSKKKSETTEKTQVEIISEVAGSKKRPAPEDNAPVIPKKRCTVKGKASLDVVPVAQDVVPLQIIESIPAATVVKSPAPKRISRKRRLVLPTGSDDEIMDTQEPVKDTDEIDEKHTDEIDDIIDQITAETSKMGLNKLSDLDGLRYLKEKEKLMLDCAETDSLETAVKRKMYILAKYREMLLRKFLASHRRYFSPGQPWTAMASQIIALLSGSHSKSLEDLLAQQKEHGIITDRPSSSQLFKDLADNSGAVLAQFYSMAKSTCWVRPMILVNGVLTPIQGNDFWRSSCRLSLFVNRRQVPESVVDTEFVPHGLFIEPVQYWGAAPSLIKTWGWARVCTEIVRYSMFGCLRLVESFEEAESVEPSAHLALGPTISGVAQEEQSYFVESPESPPPKFQCQDTSASSSDSPMHFNSDDIPLDDTADVQPTFPAVTVHLSPLLDDLKISLSKRMDDAQSDILSRLHTVERDDIQTLRFNAFKKVVLAQGVTAGADSVEVRKEIKALDAKINSLDGQVAAIRSEQLEFQSKIAADILSFSTQLGDLVDYIRGGDEKKGEGSSSRRPLPPPLNQGEGSGNRTSGDTVRTTEIAQRDIDNAQRDILERLMAADRQRERERGSRSRSGSHKRRRY
ncbi:hypothetical protein F511_34877 [Dorcoceras hygrometricum]|uniref:Dystroglycan-like n=1 Tax=Dorcoceras hygrometricum TaxID=472368 RepID=A0A2Z7C472_9LAMI|nr:hypothetical protein F511_34877 [Dorcoceras hygrometricum]